MNILSRYILRMYLRPFFASFSVLCVLIFVSQIFERLDQFMAGDVSLSHVLGYLITSTAFQAIQIVPVACLLGALFAVGTLARTREYVAGLAGGLAPEKFLGGILMAGLGISLLTLFLNETIVPPLTKYARTVYREKIRHLGEWKQTVFTDLYVSGADGRIWTTTLFNEKRAEMERVVVDTYLAGRLGTQIDALRAKWTSQGWTFYKGVQRNFEPDGATISTLKYFDQQKYPFREKPSDLITQEPQPEQMNYKHLQKRIRRLASLGVPVRKLEVELMMKLAFPFACFVVTFLGIPLAIQGQGSRAKGIAAGFALSLIYLGFMQFGKAMAQRVIPPLAGAWMANILFLAIGSYLWIKMRSRA